MDDGRDNRTSQGPAQQEKETNGDSNHLVEKTAQNHSAQPLPDKRSDSNNVEKLTAQPENIVEAEEEYPHIFTGVDFTKTISHSHDTDI